MIRHGDCLEILPTLPAESIDSIVTDPPYGLSFMGKNWDHGIPGVAFWSEALRVAKPGTHLLAFGGTRTFHRLTCAIEDAGWEIRDCIMWVYGSGFPKSHDVSKAIDREAGVQRGRQTVRSKSVSTCYAQDEWTRLNAGTVLDSEPITPEAAQWQGWGTALKPAWEPIIVARKPLVGTVAQNVQKYGTGAVNVDGCRVPGLTGQRLSGIMNAWELEKNLCDSCALLVKSNAKHTKPGTGECSAESHVGQITSGKAGKSQDVTSKADTGCFAGRFPEELDQARTDEPSLNIAGFGRTQTGQFHKGTKSTTSTATSSTTGLRTCNACGCSITDQDTNASIQALRNGTQNTQGVQGNAGRWPSNLIHDGSDEVVGLLSEAARFFYCAKASKADRDSGLDGFAQVECGTMDDDAYQWRDDVPNGRSTSKPVRRNHHPTVKPTALMRYLCRLVTPPGGMVLDPFCGSGSTGKAATMEGFGFVGIEREAEYVEIARARIAKVTGPEDIIKAMDEAKR